MARLKIYDAALTQWVFAGGGDTEPYVGPEPPIVVTDGKLWWDTDDTSILPMTVNLAQSGTYTPTLTGMNIGTGGSAINSAIYSYVGGPNIGDKGLLSLEGVVIFGTSGATYPTSGEISLPSGFNLSGFALIGNARPSCGFCNIFDSSVTIGYVGLMQPRSLTTVGVILTNVTITTHTGTVVTTVGRGSTSPTLPFIWADTDGIYWTCSGMLVTRV